MKTKQTPRRTSRAFFLLPLSIAIFTASNSLAATYWWNGATNGNLGTLGNWATTASGTAATVGPGAADDVIFSVTSRNSTNNRLSMGSGNQTFNSITLSNSGSTFIMRTSDSGATNSNVINMTLSAGITNASGAGAFQLGDTDRWAQLRIAAGSGDFVIANNSANSVTFATNVSLQSVNSTNRTLLVSGTGAGNVVFAGGIDNGGTGGAAIALRISNTGAVQIAGSTFSGGTILDTGTIALASGSALGSGGLTINGGAIGSVTSARTIANAISVAGNFSLGVTNAGFTGQATTFNGNVNLGGQTRTVTMIANSATFGGVISNGGLTINSSDVARQFRITNAATYTGPTTVQGGTLVLSNTGALDANNAVNLTATTTNVNFDISGLTGSGTTIGSLAGGSAATVALGSKTLTIAGNATNTTFSGTITGAGGALTKSGSGTITFSANSSYNGATTINGGLLTFNGTNTSTAVTINSGGTLGGSGSVGAVTVNSGGIIAPGNSPGTLSVSSLALNGGGSYRWEMTDANGIAGTGWDVINVGSGSGVITLGATSGSQFTINVVASSPSNFTASSSYAWDIIDAGSWSASFDASAFAINTNSFSATGTLGTWSVQNSSGNLRLVYTAPAAPSSSFYTWAIADGNWSVGANWTNTTAPTNGSALIFAGASGGATTNDSQVNDTSGITFSNTAGSYSLAGSAFTNGASGIVNNSASAQTISNDITLGAAQSFNAASGDLTFAGTINNNANLLRVTGASNTTVSGVISGTAGLTKSGNGSLTLGGDNSFAGALAANAGTTLLNGTQATTTVNVAGGTLLLGNNNRLADGATLTLSSGVVNFGGFSDTLTTFNISGGVFTNGTATATTYGLSGGTVGGILSGGTATVTGGVSLSGAIDSTININSGGTLTLAANHLIGNSSAVTVNAGTLATATFNDTVESLVLTNSGSITGSGTITAGAYTLNGGTVTGNLGTGTATSSAGTTTLNGSLGATTVNVNTGGTVNIGSANRLDDAAAVTIGGGTLGLGAFSDTVGSLVLTNSGSITGSGTITAGTYTLNGGTVTGNLGTGTATSSAGTTTLNGTLGATTVNVNTGGTVNIGSANRLDDTAAVTIGGGTLGLGAFSDTVGSFTITSGTLGGTTGVLTASTYALQGGTINALLGAGAITVTSGTTTLGSAGRLNSAATLAINSGQLSLGGAETVASLSGVGGTLALGANGLTIGGNNVQSSFAGTISGAGGSLTKSGTGTMILSGANTFSGAVAVNAGTLILTNGSALSDSSAVTLANTAGAILEVDSNETIGSLAGGGASGGAVALDVNTLTLNQSGNTSYTGTITGTGTLAKSGIGTLTFNQAGAIGADFDMAINAGTIDLNRSGSAIAVLLGTGNNIQLSGGTVGFTASSAANGAITLGGISVTGDSAILVARTGTASSHSTTITAPLSFSNNSNLSFTYNSIVTGGTTTFAGATNILYSNGAMTLTNYNIAFSAGIGESGGSRSLTKNGAGTLILNGVNSYTGDTIVSGGELRIGAAGALSDSSLVNVSSGALASFLASDTIKGLTGAGNVSVASSTVLTLSNAANYTFSGAITNSGGLAKVGAGTQTLSASNSYSGGTTIGEGVLAVGNNNALGSGSVTITNAAVLAASGASAISNNLVLGAGGGTITNASALTLAGTVTGGNTLTKLGLGTATFTGAIGASGGGNSVILAINEGASSLSGSSIKYITNSTVASGATLIFNGGTVATRGGTSISGLGSVSVTGNTILSNSTANNTISSAIDIASGATLSFTNSSTFRNTLNGGVSGSGNIVMLGGDTRFDTASNSFSGGVTINSGATARLINAEAPSMVFTNNGSLIIDNTTLTRTYGNSISGTGAVTVSGSSATALNGNISGSGLTISATGSGNSVSLGGSNTFNGLTISGSVGNVYATSVFGLGTGTLSSAVSSARIAIDSSLGTGINWTLTNNINAGTTVSDALAFGPGSGNAITLSGLISGSGRIRVSSSGDLTIGNAANTFTGGVDVGTGRILVGSDGALGVGGAVNFGTALNSTLVSTASFTMARAVTIGAISTNGYTANFDTAGNNLTVSGVISDSATSVTNAGKLTKLGLGTLTLSASNSYTGVTTLSNGVLRLNNANAIGTGSLTQADGTSSLQINVAGTVTNDMNVWNVAYLQGANLSGALTLNNTIFDVTNNVTATNSGTLSGTGGVDKIGAGTLLLSGNNSYSGGTSISNGAVSISADNNLGAVPGSPAAGSVTLDGGKLLITAGLTLHSNRGVALGASGGIIEVASGQSVSYGGVAAGAGAFTKAGAGSLTFSGANSYSGATTVSAGTLELANTSGAALGSTASVGVASGATLLISQNQQVNNTASVSLTGGTIRTAAGISETFGNLSITGSGFLDFGTTSYANANTISFGTYSYTPSALLSINNFNFGSTMTFSSQLSGTDLATFSFTNGGIASTSWDSGTSTFTITAIPEPSTYLAAAGLLALMVWPSRRRLIKDAKSILGLRTPARDRMAGRA